MTQETWEQQGLRVQSVLRDLKGPPVQRAEPERSELQGQQARAEQRARQAAKVSRAQRDLKAAQERLARLVQQDQ